MIEYRHNPYPDNLLQSFERSLDLSWETIVLDGDHANISLIEPAQDPKAGKYEPVETRSLRLRANSFPEEYGYYRIKFEEDGFVAYSMPVAIGVPMAPINLDSRQLSAGIRTKGSIVRLWKHNGCLYPKRLSNSDS